MASVISASALSSSESVSASASNSQSSAIASPSSSLSAAASPSIASSSSAVVSSSSVVVLPSSSTSPTSSSAPSILSSSTFSSSITTSSSSLTSTILTTPSTSQSKTTVLSASNGVTFTTIVEVTSTLPPGSTATFAANATPKPASHTGAIVGGVVGGLAVIAVAAGAFLWLRRRSRDRDEFDGDFDPVRVGTARPASGGPEMAALATGGTLPQMNIDDEEEDDGMGGRLPHSTVGGGIVTPFTYTPALSSYGPSTRSQSPPMPSASPPPMSQYSQDGYQATLSSTGGYYNAVPEQAQAVGGYYPPAPSSSGSSNPRSTKEREAFNGRRSAVFAVANPDSRGMYDEQQYQAYLQSGPQNGRPGSFAGSLSPPQSPVATSSRGVIVHRDGGRVEPDAVAERDLDEIPPTYDSLSAGDKK